MALTRKMLRSMGLAEEQVEAIIGAHAEAVDALKGFEADARRLQDVQRELDALQAAHGETRRRYEEEHRAFAAYREQAERRADGERRAALYRAALTAAGVDARRHDAILRATDLSALRVEDGRLQDEAAVREAIRREWADFIPVTVTRGTSVENPPVNRSAGLSREQIMDIRDSAARQRAIAANLEQFRQQQKG